MQILPWQEKAVFLDRNTTMWHEIFAVSIVIFMNFVDIPSSRKNLIPQKSAKIYSMYLGY